MATTTRSAQAVAPLQVRARAFRKYVKATAMPRMIAAHALRLVVTGITSVVLVWEDYAQEVVKMDLVAQPKLPNAVQVAVPLQTVLIVPVREDFVSGACQRVVWVVVQILALPQSVYRPQRPARATVSARTVVLRAPRLDAHTMLQTILHKASVGKCVKWLLVTQVLPCAVLVVRMHLGVPGRIVRNPAREAHEHALVQSYLAACVRILRLLNRAMWTHANGQQSISFQTKSIPGMLEAWRCGSPV